MEGVQAIRAANFVTIFGLNKKLQLFEKYIFLNERVIMMSWFN